MSPNKCTVFPRATAARSCTQNPSRDNTTTKSLLQDLTNRHLQADNHRLAIHNLEFEQQLEASEQLITRLIDSNEMILELIEDAELDIAQLQLALDNKSRTNIRNVERLRQERKQWNQSKSLYDKINTLQNERMAGLQQRIEIQDAMEAFLATTNGFEVPDVSRKQFFSSDKTIWKNRRHME